LPLKKSLKLISATPIINDITHNTTRNTAAAMGFNIEIILKVGLFESV